MISAGQRISTCRLASLYDDTSEKGIGNRWKPIQGVDDVTARAWCVWLNSTLGRLSTLCNRGGNDLGFPVYDPSGLLRIQCPDPGATVAVKRLEQAYQATRLMTVEPYREGRTGVREIWDDVVSEALGIAREEIAHYADLLAREPDVSKDGYEDHVVAGRG